jgi:putative transposase
VGAQIFESRHYVYIWADGVYFDVRLGEDDRNCILVIMGATADGKKELLAVKEGNRESELAWAELLLDIKSRGLTKAPSLAITDGALGFWAALSKVYPTTKTQGGTRV